MMPSSSKEAKKKKQSPPSPLPSLPSLLKQYVKPPSNKNSKHSKKRKLHQEMKTLEKVVEGEDSSSTKKRKEAKKSKNKKEKSVTTPADKDDDKSDGRNVGDVVVNTGNGEEVQNVETVVEEVVEVEEGRDASAIAEVKTTHENLLSKFKSSTSEHAEYYQTKFLEEQMQMQQQSKSLLSGSLKEKLRLRRLAQQQTKQQQQQQELQQQQKQNTSTVAASTASPSSPNLSLNEIAKAMEPTPQQKQQTDSVEKETEALPDQDTAKINGNGHASPDSSSSSESDDYGDHGEDNHDEMTAENTNGDNSIVSITSDEERSEEDDQFSADEETAESNVIVLNDSEEEEGEYEYKEEEDDDDDGDDDEDEESTTRFEPSMDKETDEEFISFGGYFSDDHDDEVSDQDDDVYDPSRYGLPWVKHRYEQENLALRLHAEIMDFYEFIKETEEERLLRDLVIERINMYIKQVDDYAEVNLFGSFAMDLVIPGSDLDMCVDISASHLDEISFLSQLERILRVQKCCQRILFVRNARVPVLKFVDKVTGHAIDVSCQMNTANPAIATVARLQKEYPAMRYLVMFLKYILKQRNLNDVPTGGLGSYALALLVVSHLQMHSSNYDSEEASRTSLGSLLLDFLALYGIHFNYVTTGISVNGKGCYYSKKDTGATLIKKAGTLGYCIHITDPNDPDNNVTRSTYRVEELRSCFRSVFGKLITADPRKLPQGSILSRVIRINDEILYRPSQVDAVSRTLVEESEKWQHEKKKLKKHVKRAANRRGARDIGFF